MKSKSLGQIIRDARKVKKMSQQEVASIINVSHVYLSNIERNNQCSYSVLERICMALDMDYEKYSKMKTHWYNPPHEHSQFQMCNIIDKWYLDWESQLGKGSSRFAFAKEQLKDLLCSPYVFE